MADPLVGVSEAAFALERRIIGNESLFRDDTRRTAWAANALYPVLFPPPHPYARPTGGTEDSRGKLTLDQARAYAAQTFRPERMTLLVSTPPGATSAAAIAAKLPPALRGDAAHPLARRAQAKRAPELARTQLAAAKVERRVSPLPMPELWIAWSLPGGYGANGPAEEVLSRWVQEDVGSLQVLLEEPSIRRIAATVQPGLTASVLFVRALLADGADPDRVARVVTARVASMWAREPAERPMFAQLKSIYETYQTLNQPAQLLRAIAEAMQAGLGERPQSMADAARALQSVESTAVAELAYRHLTRERARAVMFTPAPPSAGAQRASITARVAAHHAAARELIPGAERWSAGELAGLLPASEPVVSKKLPSGLTVVTVRRTAAAARRLARVSRRNVERGPSAAGGARDAVAARRAGGDPAAHARRPRRDPRHVVRLGRVPARPASGGADAALRQGDRPGQGLAVEGEAWRGCSRPRSQRRTRRSRKADRRLLARLVRRSPARARSSAPTTSTSSRAPTSTRG